MANTIVLGTAVTITSNVLMEDIKLLQKYKPSALAVVDKETKNEIFRIGTGAQPSFSNVGIVYNDADPNGFATCTLPVPAGLTEEGKRQFIRDKFGYGILELNKHEDTLGEVIEKVKTDFAVMDENISVL